MPADEPAARRRQLIPFAALSAGYFAHIGFFNPYLPLWLKELGIGRGVWHVNPHWLMGL